VARRADAFAERKPPMIAYRDRVVRVLPVLISLGLFLAALDVLRLELRTVTWPELSTAVTAIPARNLALSLVLTLLNYVVLAGYDVLAREYIGRRVPLRRMIGAALVASPIAHTLGFAMLTGPSVRYRFYSRWGLSAAEISRLLFGYATAFWLGLLTLGGATLVTNPPVGVLPGVSRVAASGVGMLLLLAVSGYMIAAFVRRSPLCAGRFTIPQPPPCLATRQLALSLVEWPLAASVLYVLLPGRALSFPDFLGMYLVAVFGGLVSHVPGGLGVFDGLMVLLLAPVLDANQVMPALLAYRVVYYLIPFALASVALVADEARQRRAHLARAGAWVGQTADRVVPRLLATLTFLTGTILLLSGATPALPGRLDLLNRLLPLGVMEISHFAGSVVGVGLLLLSQGLARRLDAAYYLSAVLIAAGMATSLLKGVDYEESLVLLSVFALLLRMRRTFDRRAALFDTRLSPGWLAAVAGAIGSSVWLGLFAFKHVDYAGQLWWQFELLGDASRFMRASVGVAIAAMAVGLARLMDHAPHEPAMPSEAELADAARIVAAQQSTTPNLVFLRDKALVFNDARDALVMYAVQGRSWIAMGDPVGPDREVPGLIRRFLERADDYGGIPVFYEVGPEHLHHYTDAGLTFVRVGEDARVNLATFTLDGGRGSRFRQALRRLERERASFRVIPPSAVAGLLPEFARVSEDWLRHKATAEKGFSLGFFDEAYMARFPVAVVERDGRVLAFANIWAGADGGELSVDLMRFGADAPKGVMESLLVSVMRWGKSQGYRWFSLGMAPLSGLGRAAAAPLWNRLAGFVYRHGEAVYGFRGLRAFKEHFEPVWAPRYLAYPGRWCLPRVIADTSAIIAGGYRRIFLR
jgi:phosphatidylglycerol lysyltransferase